MQLQGHDLLAAEQDRVARASASGRQTLDETIMNDYQRTQEEARARTSKAAADLASLQVAQVRRCGSPMVLHLEHEGCMMLTLVASSCLCHQRRCCSGFIGWCLSLSSVVLCLLQKQQAV